MSEPILEEAAMTDFPKFAGQFARHWKDDTAEYVWPGDDTSPDMEVWAYSHAYREPTPSWSVVVRQKPPAVLGFPDDSDPRVWGIRFACGRLGEVVSYEMTPGIDEDEFPYVHPHAPRVAFAELPKLAQARVWLTAGEGWHNADGTPMTWSPETRTWHTA